jgi:hypothetical protein
MRHVWRLEVRGPVTPARSRPRTSPVRRWRLHISH